MTSLNEFCQQTLNGGAPSVVAIDINGNRDVDGVLECLQVFMNEEWVRQPRLIVVKSRFLYWDLRKERREERKGERKGVGRKPLNIEHEP